MTEKTKIKLKNVISKFPEEYNDIKEVLKMQDEHLMKHYSL